MPLDKASTRRTVARRPSLAVIKGQKPVTQPSMNFHAAVSMGTSQPRKRKGIASKKIPDQFTKREYDLNDMSSKWDVKQLRNGFDGDSISGFIDERQPLQQQRIDKKSFAATSIVVLNGKAQLANAAKEDEYEEENSKKMITFSYHGKQFKYCKESCQLFKKEHRIRRFSVWVIEWRIFKQLTGLIIIAMAVFMGMHNYNISEDELRRIGGYQSVFSYWKLVFIFYFAIEIVLKIIATGLYQAHNSYLRNINNCIILAVFVLIALYDSEFIFLLIFRIFYVFEFTNRFKYFRQSSNILKLYSVSAETLCKLFFLIFFFITLFGILSVNIWSGLLDYRCRTVPAPLLGDWPIDPSQDRLCGGNYSCQENTYCGSNYDVNMSSTSYIDESNMDTPTNYQQFNYGITNFDNILRAYLSLFQIFLVEGFTNLLYMMEDSQDSVIPVIFVIAFSLVCTYFLNDLIIAVFFVKYQQIEADENNRKKSKTKPQPSVQHRQTQLQMKSNATSVVNHEQMTQSRVLNNERVIHKQDTKIKKKSIQHNEQADQPPDQLTHQSGEQKNPQPRRFMLSFIQKPSKVSFEATPKMATKGENGMERNYSMKMDSIKIDSNLNKSMLLQTATTNTRQSGLRKRGLTRIPYNSTSSYFSSFWLNREGDEWNEAVKSVFEIILNSRIFSVVINSLILANMILLSLDDYPNNPESEQSVLYLIHLLLIVVFLIEDAMRMFNVQKATNIVIIVCEFIIDITSLVIAAKTNGLVSLSSLKGLRILYAFTSVKGWVNYRILIDAMNQSISSVLNIMLISFFFMYLGTITGMWLFGGKLKFDSNHQLDLNAGVSPRFNFDDILSAFTSVYTSIQGEYWNNIWMDCVRGAGGWSSHTYFGLLMISGKLIFINSFISILLNSFDYSKKKADQAIRSAKALIDSISNIRLKSKKVYPEMFKKSRKALELIKVQKTTLKHASSLSSEAQSPGLEKNQLIGGDEENRNKNMLDANQPPKIDFKSLIKQNAIDPQNNNVVFYQTKINDNSDEKQANMQTTRKNRLNTIRKAMTTAGGVSQQKQSMFVQQSNKNDSEHQSDQGSSSNRKSSLQKTFKHIFDCLMSSSCFLFAYRSRFRLLIKRLISSTYWDNFFLVQIILSSVQLAIDNPLDNPDSSFQYVMGVFDVFFAVVFMLESIGVIIVNGLLFNKHHPNHAYLRSVWNFLDLFINITQMIDVSGLVSTSSLKSLRALRALRALRPLRVMQKNESLRLLVNALFKTLPLVGSLIFVTLITTWIIAIFLMSAFKGKFQYCYMDDIATQALTQSYQDIRNETMCVAAGGTWETQDYNFDNILLSTLSIFKIILGESWSSLLWSAVDNTGRGEAPRKDGSKEWKMVFYFLVFIGNTYTLNLFTGLVVINFKSIKDQISGYHLLTPLQRQWVEMQKFMIKRKLRIVVQNPVNYYRNICFEVQKSPIFDKTILACIIMNLIVMGCIYKGMGESALSAINWINNSFLVIFHIEAAIKILGIGITFYFNDDWNKFDFAVIAITDAVLFSSIFISISAVSKIPIIFRALRLGRIMKYIRGSHSLKVLIDSVYFLLPQLINIAALLFLLVFICAVFGMNLFSDAMIVDQQQSYPYFQERVVYPFQQNFQTLSSSLLIIFQCIQNQNWDFYMSLYGFDQDGCVTQTYEQQQADGYKGCSSLVSFPFFLGTVFFVRYVVISLFLALVIEGFIDTLRENEAVITPKILEGIIAKWSVYDPNASGFISPEDLYFLLLEIEEPIGLQSEALQLLMKRYEKQESTKNLLVKQNADKSIFIPKKRIFTDLIDFNARLYPNQKTHFMDLCVKLSRNAIMRNAKAKNIQDPFFIDGRIVIDDSLMENLINLWESEYPSLKKSSKKKEEKETAATTKDGFTILDYFAAKTIQTFFKQSQKDKQIKNQILESQIKGKIAKSTEQSKSFQQNLEMQKSGMVSNILTTTSPNVITIDTHENDSIDEIIPQPATTNTATKRVQRAKFFQKAVNQAAKNDSSSNFFFLKSESMNKNQESLKQFQHMHNFSIAKSQLGQKFPIKFATDFEALRPNEEEKKAAAKEEKFNSTLADNLTSNNSNAVNQKNGSPMVLSRHSVVAVDSPKLKSFTSNANQNNIPNNNNNIINTSNSDNNHKNNLVHLCLDAVEDFQTEEQPEQGWRTFSRTVIADDFDANTDTAVQPSLNNSNKDEGDNIEEP